MGGAIRQRAITWTNVKPDLCHHMASLGHNELMFARQCLECAYISIYKLQERVDGWYLIKTV